MNERNNRPAARPGLCGGMAGAAVLAWLLALAPSLAHAAHAQGNVIKSVSGTIQGGAEVVKIDLEQPLEEAPVGFALQAPARIALDFPGVSNGLGRSLVDIGQGNLKTVNVVQTSERARVVLNLKQFTSYKTEVQGSSLLVWLSPAPAPQHATDPAPIHFAESQNQDTLPLKDLDFRLGDDNTGRVLVSLPSNQIGVDIRQQGQSLMVDFMKLSLPEGLRRRLDVSDFGSPVQTVTALQTEDRVRVVIESKGLWEHSAYQSDDHLVVEVRPQKMNPAKLTPGQSYSGERLSLNFQNIEVRSLLQVIADFTNFNIVTSDTVSGAVTLRLKDVPWDQALEIIMQAKGLGMRKAGTVLWIAPKDEIAAKEKLELESQAAIQGLEPLRTQDFHLNYAKAADIAAQLLAGGATSRILSPRGSAIAEPRTNQLFVTDIASKLQQVQQILPKLDVAVRQVLIEARIVEAADSFGKSLGVRLGGGDTKAAKGGDGGYRLSDNTRVAFGTNYGNAVASSGAGGSVNTTGNFVNLPAKGQAGYDPASFAVSIFNSAASRFLTLEISALEADGKGKVVSSPRVVTADQTKALIEQGTELPYQVATSSGATSLAFRKANLKLEVTPQITPEGDVILDLDVNKDTVGQSTAAGYAIDTKHIKTQVLVENGGTVVIGGIFTLDESDSTAKVPLLGDVPVLGNLFKTTSKSVSKKEMLVFITPKIVADRATAR